MTKKNNSILRITVVILALASAGYGIVYSYGRLNSDVQSNIDAIKEQKKEGSACMNVNIRQDKDYIEIKSDMRHLKEDVIEIKEDVKTILVEIRK